MAYISVTNTLTNGQPNDASEVNQNFTDVVNGTSDGTKDLNVNKVTAAATMTANSTLDANGAVQVSATMTAASNVEVAGDTTTDNLTASTKVTTPALKVTTGAGAGKTLYSDASGDLAYMAGASGAQLSSEINDDVTSVSPTYEDFADATVTITTTGRPVLLFLQSSNHATESSRVQVHDNTPAVSTAGMIRLIRDATVIGKYLFQWQGGTAANIGTTWPTPFIHLDVVAAGTYTYKLSGSIISGTDFDIYYCKLVALEL